MTGAVPEEDPEARDPIAPPDRAEKLEEHREHSGTEDGPKIGN